MMQCGRGNEAVGGVAMREAIRLGQFRNLRRDGKHRQLHRVGDIAHELCGRDWLNQPTASKKHGDFPKGDIRAGKRLFFKTSLNTSKCRFAQAMWRL
jgi:hypothetical protein